MSPAVGLDTPLDGTRAPYGQDTTGAHNSDAINKREGGPGCQGVALRIRPRKHMKGAFELSTYVG
jgi:hypothetical protein